MNNCTKCAPGTVVPAPEYNKAGSCNQPACSLHTVIIPKAKGSDAPGQPYAPILGGYQNTILVYEATGSVYLYDENGVFTNLTGNSILPVIEALKQQVEASTEQVNTLDSTLTAEIANRQSADVDLQSLITTLQSSLNTETTARESADTTLTNNYNELKAQVNGITGDSSAEAEAREAADANLQEQIDTLQTDLTSETAAREAADNTLTNSVDNLQASIETLTTKVENATGKSGNLPDSLVQQVLVNSNPTGNNVTIQATDLDLTTGATSSTVGTIAYKTVGGVSILGEGDIPVSGGSGGVAVTQEQVDKLDGLANIKTIGSGLKLDTQGTLTQVPSLYMRTFTKDNVDKVTLEAGATQRVTVLIGRMHLTGYGIGGAIASLVTSSSITSYPVKGAEISNLSFSYTGTSLETAPMYEYSFDITNRLSTSIEGVPKVVIFIYPL